MKFDGDLLRSSDRMVVRAFRWFEGAAVWLGTSLVALAPAIMWFDDRYLWGPRVALAVLLVGLLMQTFVGLRYKRLVDREGMAKSRATRRSHAMQTILAAALRTLMHEMSDVNFGRARASVYRHKDGHFILLCRESTDRSLARRGRARYPSDGGLIAETWRLRKGYVRDLPADRAQWETACQEDYGMKPEATAGLRMQARSLAGIRLDTQETTPRPVGLVIVESLDPRGIKGAAVDVLGASPAATLVNHVLVEAVACLDEEDVDDFQQAVEV